MNGPTGTALLSDGQRDDLIRTFERLEVLNGQRTQLVGGEIVISPRSANFHNWIYAQLARWIDRGTPDDWVVTNTTTVLLPATGEHYIPDLIVCESAALRGPDDWRITAANVLLVGEITSPSTAHRDRTVKVRGCAHSLVPVYLLVDPHDGEGSTTVYANPDGRGRTGTSTGWCSGRSCRCPSRSAWSSTPRCSSSPERHWARAPLGLSPVGPCSPFRSPCVLADRTQSCRWRTSSRTPPARHQRAGTAAPGGISPSGSTASRCPGSP